jgi:hypothetical protein
MYSSLAIFAVSAAISDVFGFNIGAGWREAIIAVGFILFLFAFDFLYEKIFAWVLNRIRRT